MLRKYKKKKISQGKFSTGRSKQCFGSQLCLKYLLLFRNTPKEIFEKTAKISKKTLILAFEVRGKILLPYIAIYSDFSSCWLRENCAHSNLAKYFLYNSPFEFSNVVLISAFSDGLGSWYELRTTKYVVDFSILTLLFLRFSNDLSSWSDL